MEGSGRIVTPTDQQAEIFKFVKDGQGHAIVEARAGTGKTSTIVEALYHIPSRFKSVFLAFNTSIKDELIEKTKGFPAHQVEVMTLNAFGFRSWKKHVQNRDIKIDVKKTIEAEYLLKLTEKYEEAVESGKEGETAKYRLLNKSRSAISKLVAGAKSEGLVPEGVQGAVGLIPDTRPSWNMIIKKYNLEEEFEESEGSAIALAKEVLVHFLDVRFLSDTMTFDDQFYAPIVYGAVFPRYDFVFIDEAQDVNAIQLEAIKRIAASGSRVVAVGDTFQAIYGFRGTTPKSMGQIISCLNATTLNLSVSFRCPNSVIELANEIVEDIEAKESAEDGSVIEAGEITAENLEPGDTVLCRYNAPLGSMAKNLMRLRKPFRMNGQDFGKKLKKIIEDRKTKDLKELQGKMEEWLFKKARRSVGDVSKESVVDEARDNVDFINEIIDSGGLRDVPDLLGCIDFIFNPNRRPGEKEVLLSTVHKAKGMEWDDVIYLNPIKPFIAERRGLPPKIEEELNIAYVAVTRAKKKLYLAKIGSSSAGEQGGNGHMEYVCRMLKEVKVLLSQGAPTQEIEDLFKKKVPETIDYDGEKSFHKKQDHEPD